MTRSLGQVGSSWRTGQWPKCRFPYGLLLLLRSAVWLDMRVRKESEKRAKACIQSVHVGQRSVGAWKRACQMFRCRCRALLKRIEVVVGVGSGSWSSRSATRIPNVHPLADSRAVLPVPIPSWSTTWYAVEPPRLIRVCMIAGRGRTDEMAEESAFWVVVKNQRLIGPAAESFSWTMMARPTQWVYARLLVPDSPFSVLSIPFGQTYPNLLQTGPQHVHLTLDVMNLTPESLQTALDLFHRPTTLLPTPSMTSKWNPAVALTFCELAHPNPNLYPAK